MRLTARRSSLFRLMDGGCALYTHCDQQRIDPDIPTQNLVFELLAAPPGVVLDSAMGILTWTPATAQSSSTNLITLRVIDDGIRP